MLRLDKLELNGFKSFTTQTEFNFGGGITAVVGPNGCGKSNIADALNWVIGEQSTKSLRAEHMGDVIFNGSEARKPLGMAEVTLHMTGPMIESLPAVEPGEDGNGSDGNGNGHLAAASDARRVTITRRLFRSGESEYLIDGRRCRLRDVQELLAQVRVGSGVYSVIEQGKVDAVISSRSKDRRLLIEEAAGIALYRIRKRQAQLKLEATEANLLRINDLVGEIERQINSLKRQAARARRHARLTEAIDRAERILFHHESLRLEAAASDLRDRIRASEDQEAAEAAAVGRAEATWGEAREALSREEAEHNDARNSLHALDRSIDALRQGVERSREQESEAISRIARSEAESAVLAGRVEESESRAAALVEDLRRIVSEAEMREAALADQEAYLRLEAAAALSVESALESAREDLVSASGDVSERRNEMRRLAEARARSESESDRLSRIDREIDDDAAALDAERREIHAALDAASGRLRLAAADAAEAASSRQAEESRRESLLLEREELKGRLSALVERLDQLRAIDDPDNDPLAAAGGPRLPRLESALRPPERLDRAVDAALHVLLGARLTGSADEALAHIAALRERGRGRSVFIPGARGDRSGAGQAGPEAPVALPDGCIGVLGDLLAADGGLASFLNPILARVLVTPDLPTALRAAEGAPGFDVVTLSGDYVSRDGWIEGGAEIPEEAGIMTLRRLVGRLASDAGSARARIADLDVRIESAASSLSGLRSTEQEAGERAAALARETDSLRLRVASTEEDAARLDLRRSVRSSDGARFSEDLASLAIESSRAASALAESLRVHDELQRSVEVLSGELDALRAAHRTRSGALTSLRDAVSAVRERRAAIAAEDRHLSETRGDLVRRLEREIEERAAWQARLEESRARIESESRTLADRMAERIIADGAWASAEARLVERRQSLQGLESAVRSARKILEEARERRHTLAIEEERLSGEARGLEMRASERGWPSIAAAVADLTEEEKGKDADAVRTDMAESRARRDEMGAVNLMAVDQFRELEERYTFITTQRNDLQESIRSLQETIARINRQSRERFLDAYEKIRAGFADIFKTLFGGGRADLKLAVDPEGEDDILEAGLEISAQPPGKRLQSISLLSGGEKALTAVALLFAIFRYSPSPFCLLDEVDAPLDEANVLRFNELLRKMADDTQFIVITHNRRTMEAADMLYGVTMEEPGVSRSVSVVMGSDVAARREAARTLPELMRERHRGNGRSPARVTPQAGAPSTPADA